MPTAARAAFLGHSAVVLSVSERLLGFDIASLDGFVARPFQNLRTHRPDGDSRLQLLPGSLERLIEVRPLVESLDVLFFSHLHSDHFSLWLVLELLERSEKLRVCVPRGSLALIREMNAPGEPRLELLSRFTEVVSGDCFEVQEGGVLTVRPFEVVHPAPQYYVATPIERRLRMQTLGYEVECHSMAQSTRVIWVGESAAGHEAMRMAADAVGPLTLMLPVTQGPRPRFPRRLERFIAHATLLDFVVAERLVPPGSVLVPLHQGLWYFQLSQADLDSTRRRLSGAAVSDPTRRSYDGAGGASYLHSCIGTLWARRGAFERAVRKLPERNARAVVPLVGEWVDLVATAKDVEEGILELSTSALEKVLEVQLEEYRALSAEVVNSWESQSTLILTIATTALAAVALVEAFDGTPYIYLAASFVLSMTGFMLMEQSIRMIQIGRYYAASLFPGIRRTIGLVAGCEPTEVEALGVLGWEKALRNGDSTTLMQGTAAVLGKFAFAVAPGTTAALMFRTLSVRSGGNLQGIDAWLFVFALLLNLGIPALIGASSVMFAARGLRSAKGG